MSPAKKLTLEKRRTLFIMERGFDNLSEFARAVDEDVSNIHKVFKGKQKPKVEKLLRYALVLDANIEQMLNLFYYDEFQSYIKAKNKED